jgi:hypothetical protein
MTFPFSIFLCIFDYDNFKVAYFKLVTGESWVEFFMREHRGKFKKRRIGM